MKNEIKIEMDILLPYEFIELISGKEVKLNNEKFIVKDIINYICEKKIVVILESKLKYASRGLCDKNGNTLRSIIGEIVSNRYGKKDIKSYRLLLKELNKINKE